VSTAAKSGKIFFVLACLCARVERPENRKQTFNIISRYAMEATFEARWQQANPQEEPKL